MILGIDPGAAHVGWCVITTAGHYVEGGTIDGDFHRAGQVRGIIASLRDLMRGFPASRLVAVERVETVNARAGFGAGMARGLVLGHGVGQRIAQAFEDDGVAVREVTAEEWHAHFFARRAVDGPSVAALVRNRITGWPTRSNQHQRDAGAIALFAHTVTA